MIRHNIRIQRKHLTPKTAAILFGSRGSAYSALLVIIVIQSISSCVTLLHLSSSLRYVIIALVFNCVS